MATTPYPFVSGTVLTASQLNSTYNVPVSTKTASYTLVAADGGTRVTMNSASNTTITVDASLFSAGDSVLINNTAAGGVCTITAGTATVTTSGSLALAANAGGTLYFTSASAAIFFAAGVTAAASALTFITGASFSAVTSVSLAASTFTSTYQNYKLFFNLTSGGTDAANINVRMRASGTDNTTSNYSSGMAGMGANASTGSIVGSGISSWPLTLMQSTTAKMSITFDLFSPQEATSTKFVGGSTGVNSAVTIEMFYSGGGLFNGATQFDALSFISSAGNIAGSYKVYGYTNS